MNLPTLDISFEQSLGIWYLVAGFFHTEWLFSRFTPPCSMSLSYFLLLPNISMYRYTSFFFKHSHQLKDCMKVLISPHPQHCYYLSFFKIIILVGVKWYLSVVLICISLTVNDAEHLFMCLLAICLSLEKNNFRPFAHFFKNWATFSLLRFFLKKYIFKIHIPYQMYNLQIFSFCGLAFTSLMVPFAA